MTTTPPTAVWADGPYQLLEIPSRTRDINSHSAVYCATEMAHVHNALLRGLNSIVLQAPHVPDSKDPKYNATDVQDLLTYVNAWVGVVDHHHHTEETCIFPLIEEYAKEPGLMQGPQDEHKEFHGGLEKLQEYAQKTKPEDYRWDDLKATIDSFADSMVKHLHHEIDTFLALDRLDSADLMKCFKEGERVAKAQGNIGILYDLFPLIVGCCDRTHDGGNNFPPLGKPIFYAINYWFCRRHAGAWRFNPSDMWCRPVPLQFLPENQKASA